MLFKVPVLETADLGLVELIQSLRESLRFRLNVPRRWNGLLRRSTMGRAIRGSNSIEGFRIEREDVVAAAEGESVSGGDATARATEGYRRAMTYMLQLAKDEHFQWSEQVIKGLHYMMVEHDLASRPGQWRQGAIYVYDEDMDEQVYEGPPVEEVPGLMGELTKSLSSPDESVPYIIRAAMAHLNLTMIHPFRDGNGRMARTLQTLVLGRSGLLEPEFSSVEEYLGHHQLPYYDALKATGKGAWHPENDAQTFVRFSLRAHYYQAQKLLHRVTVGGHMWSELEEMVKKRGLPERTVFALWDAAQRFRVVNGTYRTAAEISQPVASRELTALVNKGLLIAEGEKRARFYRAAPVLLELRERVRASVPNVIPDPYPQPQVLFAAAAVATARATGTITFGVNVPPTTSTGPTPPPSQLPSVAPE